MEAACCSETSVSVYKMTCCHNLQGSLLMFVNINESSMICHKWLKFSKLTLILNKLIPKSQTVFEACTHLRTDVGLAGSLRQSTSTPDTKMVPEDKHYIHSEQKGSSEKDSY